MVAFHPTSLQKGATTTTKSAWLLSFCALALAASAISLAIGSVPLSLGSVLQAVAHPGATDLSHVIVWSIRLPRLVIAGCIGAGLGISGAMVQAIFRNPLVDPYVTGVSAGAAVVASASIALGVSFALVPALAFAGALACAIIVAALGAGGGASGNLRLVLSGLAISTLCAAIVTIVLLRSGSTDSLTILGWLAGGVGGKGWSDVAWMGVYLVAGFAAAAILVPSLNVLRLGTDAAAGLGLPVVRARFALLAVVALIAAACVAVSGIVSFVGLMVPHAARKLVGGDAAWLLPASAVAGAVVVIVADTCARVVIAPAELPLGVLLAFVGVPFFLIIARRPVEL